MEMTEKCFYLNSWWVVLIPLDIAKSAQNHKGIQKKKNKKQKDLSLCNTQWASSVSLWDTQNPPLSFFYPLVLLFTLTSFPSCCGFHFSLLQKPMILPVMKGDRKIVFKNRSRNPGLCRQVKTDRWSFFLVCARLLIHQRRKIFRLSCSITLRLVARGPTTSSAVSELGEADGCHPSE